MNSTLAIPQAKSRSRISQSEPRSMLLEAVLEAFTDGVMLLTSEGKLLHINQRAVKLCRLLQEDFTSNFEIPRTIQRMCKSMIDSKALFPDKIFVLEDEIPNDKDKSVRIRIQWMNLQVTDQPHLLVTLADLSQSKAISAILEAQQFGLTQRENEVWQLRKANYNYEEIAAELVISINTVKKHIKSIYAKQNQLRDREKCG